jgi:hypothetical protein
VTQENRIFAVLCYKNRALAHAPMEVAAGGAVVAPSTCHEMCSAVRRTCEEIVSEASACRACSLASVSLFRLSNTLPRSSSDLSEDPNLKNVRSEEQEARAAAWMRRLLMRLDRDALSKAACGLLSFQSPGRWMS